MTIFASCHQPLRAGFIVGVGWFFLLAGPSPAEGQSSPQWITESTITLGQPGPGGDNPFALAGSRFLADLGLRWPVAPDVSVGVSVAGGYDAPGKPTLVGARGRVALDLDPDRGRLEGSVGLFSSTPVGIGGILGFAYYPRPWVALVAQVEYFRTFRYTEEPCTQLPPPCPGVRESEWTYEPYASVGLRTAEEAGVAGWLLAAAWAVLASIDWDLYYCGLSC